MFRLVCCQLVRPEPEYSPPTPAFLHANIAAWYIANQSCTHTDINIQPQSPKRPPITPPSQPPRPSRPTRRRRAATPTPTATAPRRPAHCCRPTPHTSPRRASHRSRPRGAPPPTSRPSARSASRRGASTRTRCTSAWRRGGRRPPCPAARAWCATRRGCWSG